MAWLVVRPNSRDQFVNELNHFQVEVMPCLQPPCSTSNSLLHLLFTASCAGLLALNNVRQGHADGVHPQPHEVQHNQGIRS